MSPRSALALGAGPAASGSARRRPTPLTPVDRLEQLSSQLDGLIRDIRFTPNPGSHREVERRIGEAEEIASGIRKLFRSPTAPRAAPVWQDGQGRAIF